ncbi:MAG: type II secretion system protein [Planctomycetota bacterium]|nr:type II secretion system protein [Planctomycetota bacterium]
MRREGFTIIELLLALVVISLVAALSIPAYFARSEVTLENAAVLLARDLRSAQNRAAFRGRRTVVEMFPDRDGYQVLDQTGRPVTNPRTSEAFVRRYSIDGVFRGVEVLNVDFGGDRRLVYDENGQPGEAGEVTLGFDGDTRVVRVSAPGGRITILGTTSGWVDLGY